MPLSFENGEFAPKIPNQPKFPIGHISALIASIMLSVGYHHSDKIRSAVNTAVEATIDSLPGSVEEALENFSGMRKM